MGTRRRDAAVLHPDADRATGPAHRPAEPEEVYFLDLTETPRELVYAIAAHLQQTQGGDLNDIVGQIATRGLPIRAADCTVVMANPQRWC
jgi:hypothetical protein